MEIFQWNVRMKKKNSILLSVASDGKREDVMMSIFTALIFFIIETLSVCRIADSLQKKIIIRKIESARVCRRIILIGELWT